MDTLEQLLGNVLEATTGVRRPSYREGEDQTSLERTCARVAMEAIVNKQELTERFAAGFPTLSNTVLLGDDEVIGRIAEVLRDFIHTVVGVSDAEREITMRFMAPATQAVVFLIYAEISSLGYRVPPEELKTKRESIARASGLLAGYPQEISANLKHMIARNVDEALENDDLSREFSERAQAVLIDGIRKHPEHSQTVKKLGHCPAHAHAASFGELVFDLFLTAYEHVYEKLADTEGFIPDETFDDLRVQLQQKHLEHILHRI